MKELPSLRWSIFSRHKHPTVRPYAFCLVHSLKESLSDRNVARSHCLYFFFIQGEAAQKQSNN